MTAPGLDRRLRLFVSPLAHVVVTHSATADYSLVLVKLQPMPRVLLPLEPLALPRVVL